jgi:hypothetical protein
MPVSWGHALTMIEAPRKQSAVSLLPRDSWGSPDSLCGNMASEGGHRVANKDGHRVANKGGQN